MEQNNKVGVSLDKQCRSADVQRPLLHRGMMHISLQTPMNKEWGVLSLLYCIVPRRTAVQAYSLFFVSHIWLNPLHHTTVWWWYTPCKSCKNCSNPSTLSLPIIYSESSPSALFLSQKHGTLWRKKYQDSTRLLSVLYSNYVGANGKLNSFRF